MVFPPGPLPALHPYRPWRAVGDRITAARLARHWTLRQFARLIGMRAGRVRLWETGTARPQPRTLRRVATLLDIPYEELAAMAGYPIDAA